MGMHEVSTYPESRGKSGKFAGVQGKFCVLSVFFSSCIIIVTFFYPSSILRSWTTNL